MEQARAKQHIYFEREIDSAWDNQAPLTASRVCRHGRTFLTEEALVMDAQRDENMRLHADRLFRLGLGGEELLPPAQLDGLKQASLHPYPLQTRADTEMPNQHRKTRAEVLPACSF